MFERGEKTTPQVGNEREVSFAGRRGVRGEKRKKNSEKKHRAYLSCDLICYALDFEKTETIPRTTFDFQKKGLLGEKLLNI